MEENKGISYLILDKDLPKPDVDWSEIYGKSFNSRIEKPTVYIFVSRETEKVYVCKKNREVRMNTEREKIINIAYRVYKAHGSREAVKVDTKYGEFVVIDEKGNLVEEGIEKVIEVMERLQEENKK